jgi:putative hemolysin
MQTGLGQIRVKNSADWRTLRSSSGGLELKFAETAEELESVIRLRSAIFGSEYGVQLNQSNALWDFDAIDERAQHLLVIDRASDSTIGTYRLLLSDQPSGFYSQTEFDISGLLRAPGLKLELSRACIHPSHRNGTVLMLLWRGLLHCANASGASVLFGCSSVKTEDQVQVQQLMANLREKRHVDERYGVTPLSDFRMKPAIRSNMSALNVEIPPLLRMYLKAGARVAPEPAHDRIFRCVDLFTILELDLLEGGLAKRLGRKTEA